MAVPNKPIHLIVKKKVDLNKLCKEIEASSGVYFVKKYNNDFEGEEIILSSDHLEGATIIYWEAQNKFILEPHHSWRGKYMYYKIMYLVREMGYVDHSWHIPSWSKKKWEELSLFNKMFIR